MTTKEQLDAAAVLPFADEHDDDYGDDMPEWTDDDEDLPY